MTQDSFQRINNPYQAGNPVSNEMFVGREQELRGIERVLNQRIKKVVRLRGRKRSGKSSILRKVGHDMKEKGIGYGIFCDFQDIAPKIETNDDLPSEIGKAIIKIDEFNNFSDDFLNGTGDWAEKLEKLIKECLNKISPRKLVFLCDEYEALNYLFEPQKKNTSEPLLTSEALRWADNVSELPVYFIMAGSEKFGRILENKLGVHTEEIKINTLLSYEETKYLIEKPVKGELTYDEAAIKRIYRLSGGHPFYVQQICKVIVDEVNFTLHCRWIEKGVLDKVIENVIRHPHGYISGIWQKEIHKQSQNMLRRLADMLQDADENEYRKPNKDILENQEVIKWLKEDDLIEQRHDDEAVRFTIDILRHWIHHEFQHEDISPDKTKSDDSKKQDDPKPIMKIWIPAIVGVVLLLIIIAVVFGVNRKPIADISGAEFIVCEGDRLYLLRKPAEKKLLFEKMKEPQTNPGISLDNQWFVFQSEEKNDSKSEEKDYSKSKEKNNSIIIAANLRMRKILGHKHGKTPSISPDGTKIVYIKEPKDILIVELKENGELSDTAQTVELHREFTKAEYPVYLQDNRSIAFIGDKEHSRPSIFLYDPDDSFRDGYPEPDNKKIKKLSDTEFVETLAASMKERRILYLIKNGKIHAKKLAIANESETDAIPTEAEKPAAFTVTDDIISVKSKRLVIWKVEENPFRIGKYNEISDFGLNEPKSIIPLKGGRQ